ncbi:hypothetical protein GGR53DRAFT_2106 [Hypoxylon sp. FL1150]|nr:hypothetical protein GGR53DRAFT_2106 [Hypoxylon sp. FL1150]
MRERQTSGVDIPPPLRVIKRGKSMQVLSPRKISSNSLDDGPDEPLTVVKSRKSKAGVVKNQSCINELEPVHDQSSKENQPSAITSGLPWDPITPKARKMPLSRRSSSYQAGQPLSPTFLSKLRSLSTRRTLSSKTTRRPNDSRTSSQSSGDAFFRLSDESVAGSWGRSSKFANSGLPSYREDFEASSFENDSFMYESDQSLDPGVYDPYMLIPHISITPEAKYLNDGQSSIWMAVEISGQLSHPRLNNSTHDSNTSQPPFIPAHHCDPSLSRYGYLYNIRVDILPTVGNSVIDLVGDTIISTISPGSSLLVLACIRLGASKGYQPRGYKRNSDALMSDIEFQLGNITTEYAQVRLSYCHSGFPESQDATTDGDPSVCRTRLETVSTGSINRHDPVSTWAPQPTPISNPLFAIVASHWGPARANDIMHRMMSARPRSPKIVNCHVNRSTKNIRPLTPVGMAPPIPGRLGSLRQVSPRKTADPARKIWTELRQTSSSSRPSVRAGKANRTTAATTAVDVPPNPGAIMRPESTRPDAKSDVHRQRERLRETAVRNKRSIGADSLKSLVPSVPEANSECKENHVPNSSSPLEREDMHFDGRKREGRWSLGSWWQ